MKSKLISAFVSAMLLPAFSSAATVVMDFEGVVSNTGAAFPSSPYLESGMQLSSSVVPFGIFGKDYVATVFPIPAANNDNGSAIFGWCGTVLTELNCINDLMTLTEAQGNVFDLLSIDGSNLNLGQLTGDLFLTGYYAGGGSITTTLDIQLNAWQTFTFDSSWSGLSSVTMTATGGSWDPAIDNIVVSTVPVPAAVWLFGSALAGLGWMRRKQTI